MWGGKRTGRKSLQDRRRGYVSLGWIGAERRNAARKRSAVRKQVRQTVLARIEAYEKWICWRNDGKIVYRAQSSRTL